MPQIRPSQQSLRLLISSSRQQYVCKTCRAQAVRQFHSSRVIGAEAPFFKRIQQTLFGTKESKEAEEKRDKKRKERLEQQENQRDSTSGSGVKLSRNGEYEIAEELDLSTHANYVQANTWDGLERIGSEQWVNERADKGEPYIGFMPPERLKLSDTEWEELLHHITVEVLALRDAGRDLSDLCRQRNDIPWEDTRNTAIVLGSSPDTASLDFQSTEARDRVLASITDVEAETRDPESETRELDAEEIEDSDSIEPQFLQDMRAAMDTQQPRAAEQFTRRWMDLQFKDPILKFMVFKRVVQVTGHRISDPTLSRSSTMGDLYNAFKTKEIPKKLADTEELRDLGSNASNVSVHPRRWSLIDKEKAVGRWKIIEDELTARDLPITGVKWPKVPRRKGMNV